MPGFARRGPLRDEAAAAFEGVAAVFLAATMLLTIADVVLRSIDEQWRIYSVVEMVQFTFDSLVFLALPAVFLMAANITVNIFDELLPPPILRVVVLGAMLTTLVYLALVGWQVVVTGLEALEFDDQTQDLRLPLFGYWIPVWIGVGGALVAEAIVLARRARGPLELGKPGERAIE